MQYHLGTLPLPSRTELDASIRAAHAAYAVHRRTTFAQRRRMLRCFKGWLLRDLQTVIRVGARDTGKTGAYRCGGRVGRADTLL